MEEQHEPLLTPEEKSQKEAAAKHAEEHKQLLEKISRASKEISEILAKEGLTLVVKHDIAIVPKQ